MRNSKFKIQNWLVLLCILTFSFLISACRFYSLETPACTEARVAAKHFYSFHFGNDMRPSEEYRNLRKAFLTTELNRWLEEEEEFKALDAFTGVKNDDPRGYPKTFKIGRCVGGDSDPENDVFFQVQIYWHRENVGEKEVVQKDRTLEMERGSGKWLVATVNDGFSR
jgi:hypothetical protein